MTYLIRVPVIQPITHSYQLRLCLSIMYQPTESDLHEPSGPENPTAIIRASKLPDSRVLKALLELDLPEKSPDSFLEAATAGSYTSALLTAVRAKLYDNVSLLLSHGADPNGLPLEIFSYQSVGFLRFRHPKWSALRFPTYPQREEALAKLPHAQTDPLTDQEIDSRRHSRGRFWAEPSLPVFDVHREAMTALEAAAASGSIRILDLLLDAGADTTAWEPWTPYTSLPSKPSVSYLSISTPLHRAIETNDLDMIGHLLDLGFSPTISPLASITCSRNPIMTAVAAENNAAYDIFDPHADFSLLTPVYNVHILHFVAATLSLDLLLKVSKRVPLSTVPVTALLHNLLHIVCLPLHDTHINHYSRKCHDSMHELRCLDRTTPNLRLHPHPYPDQLLHRDPTTISSNITVSSLPLDDPAQTAILLYLLRYTSISLGDQDIHGNTPLHYLAGHRVVNVDLLQTLRHEHGGEAIWLESKNFWGYTPRELFEDGEAARGIEELYMPFWKDPMGYWKGGKWVDQL